MSQYMNNVDNATIELYFCVPSHAKLSRTDSWIRIVGDSLFVNLSLSLFFCFSFVLFYERWYFTRSYMDIRICIYKYVCSCITTRSNGIQSTSSSCFSTFSHIHSCIFLALILLLPISASFIRVPLFSYFLLLFVLFCQPFSDRPFLSLFLATFAIFLSYLWFLRLSCLFSLCTFHISVRDRN